jgi:long-chain acyl-CoA synthetase
MTTLVDLWNTTVSQLGDRIALVSPRTSATWHDLAEGARRVANWLLEMGIVPGDRVVVQLPNSAEYMAAWFGILQAGGVAVALHPELLPAETERLCAHCEAGAMVAPASQSPVVRREGMRILSCMPHSPRLFPDLPDAPSATPRKGCPDVRPEMLAQIIYTSGTTGHPKGVCLTHAALVANTQAIVQCLEMTDRDSGLAALPFVYSYGQSVLLTHVAVGARLVLPTDLVFWNRTLDLIQNQRITGFSGVPSTFAMLLAKSNFTSRSFPHLRYITCAGGAMPEEIFERVRGVLPHVDIHLMYGQTEASARLSMLAPGEVRKRPRSIGKGLPGVTLEVINEQGHPVEAGEIGELVARGPNLMQGYWKEPDLTAQVLRKGWLHTGDLAQKDAEGYLFIVGRRTDMIKVGSYRVAPMELEEVVLGCPEVAEVAVVGVPDPIWGQVPVAYVVLNDSRKTAVTEEMVISRVSEQLPGFKRLRAVRFVPSLPRTRNGKIDRRRLLDIESGEEPDSAE